MLVAAVAITLWFLRSLASAYIPNHARFLSSSLSWRGLRLYSAVEKDKAYDSEAITVLKGLEPVRKRPGMYIGSTGVKGLHHLVFEVVDNSVDEALAGHCTDIFVTLHTDGSVEVSDNGRGIPCSVHPATGKSSLETVLCVLHAGGKFGGEDSGYKVSGGLHGVGISVVNALSSFLTVDVIRDENFHSMNFSAGFPQSELYIRPVTDGEHRGTRVRFLPDPAVFKTTVDYDFDRLANRFDELAYLNAGLTIHLSDLRNPKLVKKAASESTEIEPKAPPEPIEQVVDTSTAPSLRELTFRHEGGISELVAHLCHDKINLHPEKPILHASDSYIHTIGPSIHVEVAMRWCKDQYTDSLQSFANGIRTADGGSHLDGFKAAVTKVINQIAKKTGKVKEGSIPGEFIREGLTAVISVKVRPRQ
jgi:DNA gyrase subunit B